MTPTAQGTAAASLLFAYVFTTFVVGAVCAGAVLVLARLRRDEIARAFLWLHGALSVLVLGALLLALAGTLAPVSATTIAVLEYTEAFVGRYAVMLALPLFAHRAFGVPDRRSRDLVVTGVVLGTLTAQHMTEFVLGGAWDMRGDVAEDVVFGAIFAYTLFLAIRPVGGGAYPPLARRFLAVLAAGLPVAAHDVFLTDGPGLRFYPLMYCVLGVVVILTLLRRHATSGDVPPRDWNLTERETEVFRLMQRGLSSKAIARHLTISPNTVKTHLSAIFEKSGFRTRIALIALTRDHPTG